MGGLNKFVLNEEKAERQEGKIMNSYERIMSAFKGEKPDTTPVFPMVREWCSAQAGIDFLEEIENVEKHVFSQSFCAKQFDYDVVWDMYALQLLL